MANKISSKDNEARADSSPVAEIMGKITGQSVVMTVAEQTAKRGRLFSQNIKAGFFILPRHFAFSSLVLMLFLASNMAHAVATCGGTGSATGVAATACGDNSKATGTYSTAAGWRANAAGFVATAIGSIASASSDNSVAIGRSSSVHNLAVDGIAIGHGSTVSKVGSIAVGVNAQVAGKNSLALGASSRALRDNEMNIGFWGVQGGLLQQVTRTISGVSEGRNDDEAVNKAQLDKAIAGIAGGVTVEEAQGYASTAQTAANTYSDEQLDKVLKSGSATVTGSFAIGQGADAGGENSTAAGQGAQAVGANSMALGAFSRAERDNEVNIGVWKKRSDGIYIAADDYIQTGRILSGVADGLNANEAVNKKQLDDIASVNKKQLDAFASELATYSNRISELEGKPLSAPSAGADGSTSLNQAKLDQVKQYTDDTARQTLQKANDHSEQRAVVAENNAVTRAAAYTDNSATVTLEKANSYTDNSATATLDRANSYSSQRALQAENSAVARANSYTNHRVNVLKQQMDRNEKRANGGIAGAMAMSAIPSVAGHDFSFGMAISGYRDQGAIAAGMKANITPDTSVSVNTAWDSANGVGVAAGFSVGW